MAITLEKLCKQVAFLYKMKLEAGENGLKNIVKWVHILEDDDVSKFLHGNELIFTTGIIYTDEVWLLNFIKKLNEKCVSGIVINIGPHIKSLPKDVIEYCNKFNLPLYSVPWETRLVDITKDLCKKIVQSEHVEESIVSIFKNIIFESADISNYIPLLERKSFHANNSYTVLAIYSKSKNHNASTDTSLKFYLEKVTNRINDLAISFTYENNRIVILSEYTEDDISTLITEIKRQYLLSHGNNYIVGIGSTQKGFESISKSFKRAMAVVNLCIKKNQSVLNYNYLDTYQILLEAGDYSVLKNFYNKILKPIELSDSKNNTNYMKFIETYLESNGSVQIVAEKMFMHRNSILYQLNKIHKLTGADLTELNVKLNFLLCLYIKDLL